MTRRSPWFGSLLLLCPLVFLIACDQPSATVTAPSALSTTGATELAISAEPATLRPEFMPGLSCASSRPFGTRVIVVVGGHNDVVVRGLRFRFTDRFGVTGFPNVMPIPGSSPMTTPATSIPAFSPIPVPGVAPLPQSPIPIPGSTSADGGFFVAAGRSHSFPFFLSFGCGFSSTGTLFVMFDFKGNLPIAQPTELRLHVGD